MKTVEDAILSTDLATYFDKHKKFGYYVENGEFDWQNEDKKERKYDKWQMLRREHDKIWIFSFVRHDDDGMWCECNS